MSQPIVERGEDEPLIRALSVSTFLLWLGASCILPLLPQYLRHRGGSDGVIGAVMASYFVAALLFQYPAGRLADRLGRRRVLLAGLGFYAAGSVGFLLPLAPTADVVMRGLQGLGAGAAEVAALAMISGAVSLDKRGRAFGRIYGSQLAGMALGPLGGSLLGIRYMRELFLAACATALFAGLAVATGRTIALHDHAAAGGEFGVVRPRLTRPLAGSLVTAAALGLTIGVYESCWTLLLLFRHAHDWQIGLSWTMFAAPFALMSRPGGWLADHLDRRWLVVGSLCISAGFCCLYPFIDSLFWLVTLGAVEAIGMAVSLPAAQSLLTQSAAPETLGRVQGLFSSSETAAIAVSAGTAGSLFAIAPWAAFLMGGLGCALLAATLPAIWHPVVGKVTAAAPKHTALPAGPSVIQS